MRITLGVLEPDAGTVRFQGRPVDTATRRTFGYMPEDSGMGATQTLLARLSW
jgi:ABC-2 type transport system ATP-binding protein